MGIESLKGFAKLKYDLNSLRLRQKRIAGKTTPELYEELGSYHTDSHSSAINTNNLGAAEYTYDLDIIIPAYNVEAYIDRCLSSLLNQKTSYSYRLIVIEDCSTDGTREKLRNYQAQNSNLLLILNETNRGISHSRNCGLAASTSKYLMFVDSDDEVLDGAIDQLMNLACQHDADVVEGGFITIDENDDCMELHEGYCGETSAYEFFRGEPWGKVMRRELFSTVIFPEGYWYEDTIFKLLIYPSAKKAFALKDPVYGYRIRRTRTSVTSRYNSKCLDACYIHMQLFEDRGKLKIPVTQDYYEYLIGTSRLVMHRVAKMPENVKQNVFLLYGNFVKDKFSGYTSSKFPELEYALKNKRYEYFLRVCREYD